MGVWECGSVWDFFLSHTPILPYSHTPILPYSHTPIPPYFFYSYLSAVIGSTFVARRAGT